MSGNPVVYAETASGEYVPLRADSDGNLQIDIAETEQAVTQGSDSPWSVEQSNGPWNQNIAQIAGNAPQMDGSSSGKQAVSLHAQESNPGDTPVAVSPAGRMEGAIAGPNTGTIGDGETEAIPQVNQEDDTVTPLEQKARETVFNGTGWDRRRGNVERTIATGETDASNSPFAFTVRNGTGIVLYLHVDSTGGTSPSIEAAVDRIDPVSGATEEVIRTSALSSAGLATVQVHPALPNSANATAGELPPRNGQIRIILDTADGDETYQYDLALALIS